MNTGFFTLISFFSILLAHEICIPDAKLSCGISNFCSSLQESRKEGWYPIGSSSCCPVAQVHCPSGVVRKCPGGFVGGKCYGAWTSKNRQKDSQDDSLQHSQEYELQFDGERGLDYPLCPPIKCHPLPTVTISACSSTFSQTQSISSLRRTRSYSFTPTCSSTSSLVSSSSIMSIPSSYQPAASSSASIECSSTTQCSSATQASYFTPSPSSQSQSPYITQTYSPY